MVGSILSTLELVCWGDVLAALQSPGRRSVYQHPGALSASLLQLRLDAFLLGQGWAPAVAAGMCWNTQIHQETIKMLTCSMPGWAQGSLSMQQSPCCGIPNETVSANSQPISRIQSGNGDREGKSSRTSQGTGILCSCHHKNCRSQE